MEKAAALEDFLHRVHHGPAEDEGEVLVPQFRLFPDDGVQGAEDLVAVLGFEDVLELVDDQQEGRSPVRGDAEGEPQDGLHVLFVQVPVQGEDGVAVGEGLGVEDEVGAVEVLVHEGAVFGRGRGHHADDGGAVAAEELLHRPDVQDRELADDVGPLGVAGEVHRLLDEGGLAGLGRLVQGHVGVLGDEVRQDRAFGLPADEILAGHEFVIRKGCVHRAW